MIGIMQPYFLPYLGHLQLMEKCEKWVIFDDIQFIDKGWINRNKIAHPSKNKEFQFITIPLKNRSQKSLISSLKIDDEQDWRETIKGKFSFYKRNAIYFNEAKDFLNQILDINSKSLSEFLYNQIIFINDYFNLKLNIVWQSRDITSIRHSSQLKTDEWAIEIAKYCKNEKYINPETGIHLFDIKKFKKNRISLYSFQPKMINYKNIKINLSLSILDTLANLGYLKTLNFVRDGNIKLIQK